MTSSLIAASFFAAKNLHSRCSAVHVNREISFTFHVSLFTTSKGTTHEEPPTTIDYRL